MICIYRDFLKGASSATCWNCDWEFTPKHQCDNFPELGASTALDISVDSAVSPGLSPAAARRRPDPSSPYIIKGKIKFLDGSSIESKLKNWMISAPSFSSYGGLFCSCFSLIILEPSVSCCQNEIYIYINLRFLEICLSWWPEFEFQMWTNFFNYEKRYNSPLWGSPVCQKSNSSKPFHIVNFSKSKTPFGQEPEWKWERREC